MLQMYKKVLFEKHILVNEDTLDATVNTMYLQYDREIAEHKTAILIALGRKFGIRITKNPKLACMSMLRDAAEFLGEDVPEPFYRRFPDSVRELTPDQLRFDQLVHYTATYGFGWFDEPGHSIVEGDGNSLQRTPHCGVRPLSQCREMFAEAAFEEKAVLKDFVMLSEEEAVKELKTLMRDLLSGSRPLNEGQLKLIKAGWKDFGSAILPEKMPCKDTVVRLYMDTRNDMFCRYLVLSDVIKLLNAIQYEHYQSENLKALNLTNKDRKLIAHAIDWFFESPEGRANPGHYADIPTCYEKRKIWCGMLHHLHYKPRTKDGVLFVKGIRNGKNQSELAVFEKFMSEGNPAEAAKRLAETKGSSMVLRNLNYILSRCETVHEIEEVFACLDQN